MYLIAELLLSIKNKLFYFTCLLVSLIISPSSMATEADNAIAWIQSSAEYRAIVSQTYKNAATKLQEAVFDNNWTAALEQLGQPGINQLPNAIILDLDDTLISTMPYRGELALNNNNHSEKRFIRWMNTERAKLIPHVLGLIKKASTLGITVLLISDRVCYPNPRDPCPVKTQTLKTLSRLSLVFPKDHMFFRGEFSDWNKDQSSRRAFIAKRYRVLMIIGDDINQMIPQAPNLPASARIKLTDQYDEMWGEKWFIIPNPVYGSWLDTMASPVNKNIQGY